MRLRGHHIVYLTPLGPLILAIAVVGAVFSKRRHAPAWFNRIAERVTNAIDNL